MKRVLFLAGLTMVAATMATQPVMAQGTTTPKQQPTSKPTTTVKKPQPTTTTVHKQQADTIKKGQTAAKHMANPDTVKKGQTGARHTRRHHKSGTQASTPAKKKTTPKTPEK